MIDLLYEEKGRIYLKLDKAPIPPTRKALKDMGFKWNTKRQCYIAQKELFCENHSQLLLMKNMEAAREGRSE